MKRTQYLIITFFAVVFFIQTAFVQTAAAQSRNEAGRQLLNQNMQPDANVEEFRQEYEEYLVGMQELLTKIGDPAMQEKLERFDASEQRTRARQSAMEAKAENLVAIHELLSKFPNWRKDLTTAKQAFGSESARAFAKARKSAKKAGGENPTPEFLIPDFCPDASVVPTINDVAALQSLIIIAEGVMELLPTDTFTFLARAIPVGLYTVAQEVLLAAQTLRDLDDQCTSASKDDIQDMIDGAKDSVIENSNSNKSEIVENDNANKTALSTELSDAKTMIVNNDNTNTAALDAAITKAKNEILADAKANKNEILADAKANKEELRLLILKTQIEADLATESNGVKVAAYMLPTAKGGYLDMVQQIVTKAISDIRAAGGSVGTAQSWLDKANADKAAGNFKSAYDNYRKAYKAAAN